MKRPSGTTVVTAVLGAFVVFGIVSNHLAKRADAMREFSLHSSAGAGLGYLLNGAAWKAGFAADANEPTSEPVQASLPVVSYRAAASKTPLPAVRQVAVAPARPIAEETTEVAPIETKDASREEEPKKESAPPPQGRMGLAGPAVQHKPPAVPAAAPPALPHHPVPEPGPSMPQPRQKQPEEFGPSIFKRMDSLGGTN